MSDAPVLLDISDGIATVTLNRPEVRNALSGEVLQLLQELMSTAEADDNVGVVVLTGADPAFCSGLDLDELGSTATNMGTGGSADAPRRSGARGPFPRMTKPLIGAINGVAVTGGFELALNCDFLIASELAKFGDTHARVGVMPAWGLTVLDEALRWGLVNHVVPHAELIPFTRSIAADIVDNESDAVRQIRQTYAVIAHDDDGWETEARDSRAWGRSRSSPDTISARRAAIQERGRKQ
jgi:enoyl-CoA hydratase